MKTILEKLRFRATISPDEVCYTYLQGLDEASSLTSENLDHAAMRIALELLQRAVPGDRVLLLLPSGLEYLQSFWGCLYAGMIAVPLYPPKSNDKSGKIKHIISDCRPALAIVLDELPTEMIRELGADGVGLIEFPGFDITLEGGATSRLPDVGTDAIAFLQYSSGSTGNPKGVTISHRNILANLGVLEVETRSCAQDVFVTWLPLFHDMGMVMGVLMAMYVGARSIIFSPFKFAKNPLLWIQVMSRYGGTISGAPNFAYDTCARRFSASALGDVDLSSWRLALNGAEPVRADTLSSFCTTYSPFGFKETAIMPAYGMAEATVFLCGGALLAPPRILAADRDRLQSGVFCPADGEGSRSVVTIVGCGVAPAAHDIIVVNDAHVLAEGQVGEVWVRGESIAAGYWGRTDDSQAVFQSFTASGGGPYLRTGDLAFIESGELFLLGRMKDVLIVQGRNIHPHDIEACTRKSLPENGIGDAVAFGIDGAGTEDIVLILEVRPRFVEDPFENLAANIRSSVFSSFGIVINEIAFVRVGVVAKTTSGKVMRRAMRDRYRDRSIDALHISTLDTSAAEYVPLATDTELRLAKIWEEVLGVSNLNGNSNFLQLGGSSLTIAQMIENIRSQWGVDLPLVRVFEGPTLTRLASLIDQTDRSANVETIAQQCSTDVAPCSFQQRRLWFLAQMGDDLGVNENLSVAIRLKGMVDIAALNLAFSTIVERHEALRTRFGLDEVGDPMQWIAPIQAFEVKVVDLASVEAINIEKEVETCVRREVDRRFDLAGDLLQRACLVHLPENEHVLLLNLHHIAVDGWSLGILVKELSALYSAYAEGKKHHLSPLKVRYNDYACWQGSQSQSHKFASDEEYWRRQLTGIPAVHGLPLDFTRTSSQRFCGATLKTYIGSDTTAQLHDLCVNNAATLFMGLHAVFSLLLSRFSNEPTIVIGTAIANRQNRELHELIGLFANIVALRSEVDENASFCDLMRQSRQTVLDACDHQSFPFEKVVEMLHPQRDLGVTPVFQVLLLLQDDEYPTIELPGLSVRSVEEVDTFERFDLTLSVRQTEQELCLTWKYNSGLFRVATIERIATSFSVLLEGILCSPTSKVSALPLLNQQDRHRLLHTLNATQAAYSHEHCIHELFEAQVEKTPHHTAVMFEEERLTYTQLNERANQLAHCLREAGVGADTLVGLCMERSLEMVVGLLGILKAAGAYVPLDPGYPQERLSYMIADSGVTLLLTQEALLEQVRPLAAQSGTRILSLDGAALRTQLQSFAVDNPPRQAKQSSQNLAYVIYTSGSTGQPKGAMNEHRAVVNRLLWMQERYALETQDRILQKTPFSFDVSVWEFFWPLLAGARLIVARPEGHKDPVYLKQLIQQRGVTRLHFVPSMLQAFLEQCYPGDCASVRQIVCSGEELSSGLLSRCRHSLPQVRVSNLYGPTEAAVDVTSWECGSEDEITRVPIGQPIANVRIYILGADRQPVPIGVAGEIWIGGVAVGRGYLNRPELTAERFVPDPFSNTQGRMYRTGDLGRWRADGAIEYLGRNDHQVKIRGFRIELGEIESQLMRHAQIGAAAVVAMAGADGEKRLVAYVTLKQGGDSSPTLVVELKANLERTLPEYMVPALFVVLNELPLTSSGKIDRRALPAPEIDLHAIDYVAPQTPTEKILVEICAELLQLNPQEISTTANFFALGGHSLLVVKFMMSVKSTFNVELGMREIHTHPNVHSIARSIDALQGKKKLTMELLSLPSTELEQIEF